MDTVDYHRLVFMGVLSMRFHPKNLSSDYPVSDDEILSEVLLARRVADAAVAFALLNPVEGG